MPGVAGYVPASGTPVIDGNLNGNGVNGIDSSQYGKGFADSQPAPVAGKPVYETKTKHMGYTNGTPAYKSNQSNGGEPTGDSQHFWAQRQGAGQGGGNRFPMVLPAGGEARAHNEELFHAHVPAGPVAADSLPADQPAGPAADATSQLRLSELIPQVGSKTGGLR